MVITVSDHDSKSTSPSERPPDLINAASNSTLLSLYQVVSPPMSPTFPLITSKTARERAWRRFAKAFAVAAIVYILLGILTKSFMVLAERHFVHGVPSVPQKEDGRIISCANETWSSQTAGITFPSIPPYKSTNTFNISVSTSHVFLFSRGSYGYGTIKMELSNRSDDRIEIEVTTWYYSLEARDRANICHLARDKSGEGLGIYTPRRIYPGYPDHDDQISFDITIRFPLSGSSKLPLVINSLETKMGLWIHDITSFDDHVMFKSLSLSGSNAHIRAKSVSAEYFQLKTSNAPITGSYNVSNSLILKTSNAAIKVTVRMENNDGNKATRVDMKTSNAYIESAITLVSTDNSSVPLPAAFSVDTKTSNSPIALSVPEAPTSPFALLDFNAKTSNAAVNTRLHPTYEGSVNLKTTLFTPSLLQKSNTTDPSGRNRHHNVEIRKVVRGVLEAGVWWGHSSNKDQGKGTVVVTTSNAANTLEWA